MTYVRLIEEPKLVTLDTGNFQVIFYFEVCTKRGGILRDTTSNHVIAVRMTRRLHSMLSAAGYREHEMIRLMYAEATVYIKRALIEDVLEEETVLKALGPKDASRLKDYDPERIDMPNGFRVDLERERDIAKQTQKADNHTDKQMKKPTQVFLCHASEDKDEVMTIYQRLKDEGFKPWIDKEDLLPGQDWDREIRRVIKESDCSLAFFSKNSVSKRGYYQKELKLLLEVWKEVPPGQIYVIPVRLDDECKIPVEFEHLHYVNLFEAGGFDKVLEAIHTHPKPNDESTPTSPLVEAAPKPQTIEKESLFTRVEELTGLLAESLSSGRLRGITREEASRFLHELFNLRGRLRKHSGLLQALRDFENTTGWMLKHDGTFETANERTETLNELEERYQQVIHQVELVQSRIEEKAQERETKVKELYETRIKLRGSGGQWSPASGLFNLKNIGSEVTHVEIKSLGNLNIETKRYRWLGQGEEIKIKVPQMPSPLPERLSIEISYVDKYRRERQAVYSYVFSEAEWGEEEMDVQGGSPRFSP